MSASVPVQIGQVIDNKFRIDRVLAQGGMGVLCAATHLHLDQKIAVKFRLAGSKMDATRFIREAQLAVRLQNRHVCRVMDLGYIGEATPYIVMEYLDGNDLAKEVEDRGPLPIEESVEYILQACDAMAEAHSLGIVHRDIKPENLFLARQHDGRSIVKVLDFGISKQHGVTLTTESDLMGTPAYMAHEQWASAKHVTASSDVYALGATLHFLLSGAPPFHATTIPEMFAKISTEKPPPLRTLRVDVPIEIEMLVLRCLARTAAERPADVLEISDTLLPFAPGRKRAALSVVGRAFGRPSSNPTNTDGASTQPMTPQQIAVATGSPLSTNDLAIGVRSSSDEVSASPPKRWKTAAIALGGLATIAVVAIAIASSGRNDAQQTTGSGSPMSTSPAASGTTSNAPPAPPPPATAEPDAAVLATPDAAEPDAAMAVTRPPPNVKRVPAKQDAGVRAPSDARVATPAPTDAAVSVPPSPPADAAVVKPEGKKDCPPGDYRCALRK